MCWYKNLIQNAQINKSNTYVEKRRITHEEKINYM